MFVHSVFYISFGYISIVGGVVGNEYFLENVHFQRGSENADKLKNSKKKTRNLSISGLLVEISGIEPLTS